MSIETAFIVCAFGGLIIGGGVGEIAERIKAKKKARRRAGFMPPAATMAPWALRSCTLWTGARTSSPESACSSSFCPLPDTPAMPTTSPARTCSSMPCKSTPNACVRASESCCTRSTTRAAECGGQTRPDQGGALPVARHCSPVSRVFPACGKAFAY